MNETAALAPGGPAAPSRRAYVFVMRNALPFGFAGLAILFVALGAPNFLTFGNVSNIVRLSAPIMMVAIPMAFLLIMGYVDLSVGSQLALSAVVAGLLITNVGVSAADRDRLRGGRDRWRGAHQRHPDNPPRAIADHRDAGHAHGRARDRPAGCTELDLCLLPHRLRSRLVHGRARHPVLRDRRGGRRRRRGVRAGVVARWAARPRDRRERGSGLLVRYQFAPNNPRRVCRHRGAGRRRRRHVRPAPRTAPPPASWESDSSWTF